MRPTRLRPALPWLLALAALGLSLAPASAGISPQRLGVDPGRTLDLSYPEPTPVTAVYRALGDGFGVEVAFDPFLHDREVRLEARDATFREALERVTASAGHFAAVLEEGTLVVADDTPHNRRQYTQLAVRELPFTNLRPDNALTILRAILDLKKLATTGDPHLLVVRDTVDKVELAARLLERIDRPQGEIQVGTEVLAVDREALEALLADHGSSHGPPALSADELDAFRRRADGRTLARPTLHLLEGERARLFLQDTGPSGLGVDMDLKVTGRLHPGTEELTLEVELEAEGRAIGDATSGDGAAEQIRALESSFRVPQGPTYLLVDWLPPATTGDRALLFTLTPRIVRGAQAVPGETEPLRVGTESRMVTVE